MSTEEKSTGKNYVPALGFAWLTPVYDLAVSALTRENKWRKTLAQQINPKPANKILDVGCGTGSLLLLLKKLEPEAYVTGLDPDKAVLSIARKKIEKQGLSINFINGFFDPELFSSNQQFDKVTSSLVLHQVPLEEKNRILKTAFELLQKGGSIHIADYGLQRTWLMRSLFNIIQILDGYEFTTPNAKGVVPEIMRDIGFSDVEEKEVIQTPTGSISVYFGRKG